jgi:2-keto-4-pentenoate hydratase/2-oxohepta-3-ene-1,7-dioic acid hydratase in catechol pathway
VLQAAICKAYNVIATGTPKGVGLGFDSPRYLQSGDYVRISIDGLGTLVNRVG